MEGPLASVSCSFKMGRPLFHAISTQPLTRPPTYSFQQVLKTPEVLRPGARIMWPHGCLLGVQCMVFLLKKSLPAPHLS